MSLMRPIVKPMMMVAFVSLITPLAFAQTPAFLPVHEAFKMSEPELITDPNQPEELAIVRVKIEVADGYYLNKDALNVSVFDEQHPEQTPSSVPLQLPIAKQVVDELGDEQEIYSESFSLDIPLKALKQVRPRQLRIQYQGCAANGFCYPPIRKEMALNWTADQISSLQLN